jgi:glycosyltransferase involved in cell wall biosynthesis
MRFDDYFRDLTIDRRADAPQTPTVSIILSTYARADGMLGRSIDSVLSQSYGDFELIVVDDGSRDGTADLLSEYRRADSRVSVHRYHLNSGLPALRVDQAVMAARGRLIGYQFDDDVWTPESLAIRIEALRGREAPTVVYGAAEVELAQAGEPPVSRRLGEAFDYWRLVRGNFFANSSVLHPITLFEIAGMYDPHVLIRRLSDYDLWLRFGAVADFVFVDAVVSKIQDNQPNSLGRSTPLDYTLTRRYLATERNEALKPGAIRSYDVTGTARLRRVFSDSEIDQIRRRTIIPFLTTQHDHARTEDLLPAMISRRTPKTLLVTKPDFSTSVDVTIHNFTDIEDCPYRDFFVPERDLDAVDWNSADTVVLYRTTTEHTTYLLREMKEHKPFVYLMDDNMLRFAEVGPEHAFLGPGTPARAEIESQIREAHACIGYSDQIIADMRALNPHVLRLDTNIPLRFLEPRPYRRGARLSVAVLSGATRRDIMAEIWPALVAFAEAAPDAVEFHFWGLDPSEFGSLPCPVEWRPFTHAYDLYRTRLLNASFDIMLVPLDDTLLASHSKSPVKLLESICCGAICIFTDAPPYRDLPDDICLKTANTFAGWQSALDRAHALGPEGRTAMLERARAFTQERYATERHLVDFTASFDAGELHRHLGRRSIAYVFHETALGGATLHLLRHAQLARSMGFELVGVIKEADADDPWGFTDRWNKASGGAPLVKGRWRSGYTASEDRMTDGDGRMTDVDAHRVPDATDRTDGETLAALLEPHHAGLIHAATWNPTAAFIGKSLKVPVALSLHQFFPTEPGSAHGIANAIHCSSRRYACDWEEAMQTPVRRIVCPVEPIYFDSFPSNLLRNRQEGMKLRLLISGTIQPRKNQLEAIRAIGLLVRQGYDATLDLIGYDEIVPNYPDACRQAIVALGLQNRVTIHGFTDAPEEFYQGRCDILLMASTDESMPQTVLQAMAAGLLVVTTDAGGVGEIIRHRYGGIVAKGTGAAALAEAIRLAASLSRDQVEEILRHARRSIELIARENYVRAELIDLYNEAFESWERHERPDAGKVRIRTTAMDRADRILALQARIRQLEGSLSYRITAPLRALARRLPLIARLAERLRHR